MFNVLMPVLNPILFIAIFKIFYSYYFEDLLTVFIVIFIDNSFGSESCK